jgi:hypothetical protein
MSVVFPNRPAQRDVRLVDVDATHQSASAPAVAGAATLTFGPPNSALLWRVEKIVVQTSDGLGSSALVYIGDPKSRLSLVAGTSVPGLDFDDEGPPLLVLENEQLAIVFAGLTAGATAGARIQMIVSTKG